MAQETSGQETPKPIELEFTATIAGGEVGREKVSWTPDGWTAEGRFDIFGRQQAEYRVEVKREQGTLSWSLQSGDNRYEASFGEGTFEIRVPGTDKRRERSVEGSDVFVYEDLLWGSFLDLGHRLCELDSKGELEEGHRFDALIGSVGRALPVTVESRATIDAVVDGQRLPFRTFGIDFAGAVDMVLTCDPRGMVVRVEVPAQQVVCVATGFEAVGAEGREPTSIVDSGPWRELLSKPELGVEVRKGVRVAVRDGTELACDLYLPEGDGPFPTVLARTPYGRGTEGGLKGNYYAKRGYAFVAQDVRGRNDSDGEFVPFFHETDDGSDTIDWIAEQSWSDGKVGMVGASYVGLVQWLAAKSDNPHLICIVPQVSPPDPHENFPYEGGTFIFGAVWWARVLESMDLGEDLNAGVDWLSVFDTLPASELDTAVGAPNQSFLDEWIAHPPHDVGYWEPASYQGSFGRMSVPAFHITGWWDGDQPGALQNFAGMQRSARTRFARDNQFLVVGPWTHFFNTQSEIGDVSYGDEAVVDLDSRIVRFFDRYLKGVENGIEEEPHVMTFTMGTNEWHAADTWPLEGTEFVDLYLASGGHANSLDGDGRLSLTPGSGDADSDSYDYDPFDLLDLSDVDFTDLSGAAVVEDESDREERADELEFVSPKLATDAEVVGPIEAVLFVRSDAEDTDFTVELYRVTEAGEHFAIRAGIQRLRYASDPLRDRPVPPGTVAEVRIDCWASGLRLRKGERLLARISSHGWPGVLRNFNTLESALTATEGVVAKNTILHDREHPSRIVLPVVPRDGAPGLRFE